MFCSVATSSTKCNAFKPLWTCCVTSSLSFFLDHPGFHYSADGDKKDSPQTKEGPTPRRGRRKGTKVNKLSKKLLAKQR